MSDLVYELRALARVSNLSVDSCKAVDNAADRIEQLEADLASAAKADPMTATSILLGREIGRLERELAKVQYERNHMVEAHAAEKALADQYRDALSNIAVMGFSDDPAVAASIARYAVEMARKARVL